MSDIYKNPSESQAVFNECLNALKDRKESLSRTCDQRVRRRLDGLNKLDEYDLVKVKSVKELLIRYLREVLKTNEFKRKHESGVENMMLRKIYAFDTGNLDSKINEVTDSMRELEIYLKKLKDKTGISKNEDSENSINILNNNYRIIKASREYCSKWKDSH